MSKLRERELGVQPAGAPAAPRALRRSGRNPGNGNGSGAAGAAADPSAPDIASEVVSEAAEEPRSPVGKSRRRRAPRPVAGAAPVAEDLAVIEPVTTEPPKTEPPKTEALVVVETPSLRSLTTPVKPPRAAVKSPPVAKPVPITRAPAARRPAAPKQPPAERPAAERAPLPIPETVPIAVAAEPAPASPLDQFRGLLGQPVGLRLDSVSRTYRMGEVKVDAVRDVSLEIAPGEFVAIVGPSGCGKTTLLGLLGGLDQPTSGHVYAAGAALDQLPESALADYRLQRVGTIFQTFNLIPSLSAEDNVAMPLLLAGVPGSERRDRARRLLGVVGLESRLRFRPGRMSGGEQQRVAVARALCGRPGLVLADEPTGNLDSANGEHVLELLEDLHRRGATVVLVTHDPEVASRADRVVKMRDGRIVTNRSKGRKTARAPLSLDPPTRLAARDALMIGVDAVGRRPLRTSLTAAGTALGMVLTGLILSLSQSTNLGRGAAFLAGLTLLVAAFGIVNTMYTSVLDRTREIGVFKALGARSQDVTLMFIAESGIIGGAGGVLGAAVAGLLANLGNRAAGSRVFAIDVRIGAVVVLLAIGLSLLSGILPALRAARQDPMRALRYE